MIITLDINQTAPIDRMKHPILLSPNIITSFDIVDFQGFVRCRGDFAQQQLMDTSISKRDHRPALDSTGRGNIFKYNQKQLQFVKDWKDKSITMDTICTFGKHQAVNMSEKLFIELYQTAHHKLQNSNGNGQSNWRTIYPFPIGQCLVSSIF